MLSTSSSGRPARIIRRELAAHDHHVLDLDSAPFAAQVLALGGRDGAGLDRGRDQSLFAQHARHHILTLGVGLAAHRLALRIARNVCEGRHAYSP